MLRKHVDASIMGKLCAVPQANRLIGWTSCGLLVGGAARGDCRTLFSRLRVEATVLRTSVIPCFQHLGIEDTMTLARGPTVPITTNNLPGEEISGAARLAAEGPQCYAPSSHLRQYPP